MSVFARGIYKIILLFSDEHSAFLLNSMKFCMLLYSVDPSLGRVDYSSFSDQTLMEMVFEGFDEVTKQRYQDEYDTYIDVCAWSCVECDADERVIEVKEYSEIIGTIQLSYLPSKLKALYMQKMQLKGSVELANLPESMEILNLRYNRLTGSIDLTHLPNRMEQLYLKSNQCSGSLDLTLLPESMRFLYLDNNQFSGSVDVSRLPRNMQQLMLQKNQLSGSFGATNISHCLKLLDASRNKFSAKAVVDLLIYADINLIVSGVTAVVDENGNTHPKQSHMI